MGLPLALGLMCHHKWHTSQWLNFQKPPRPVTLNTFFFFFKHASCVYMLFYSHSRLFKICLSWGWDVLLVVVWPVLWACLWITCRVLVIPSLHLLHHTFKGLIASSNPSQLVKPAHLIFYSEECFMHGLFMLENVVPLCFISDIVCISFRIQGYSVGALSHPPHDLWHVKRPRICHWTERTENS